MGRLDELLQEQRQHTENALAGRSQHKFAAAIAANAAEGGLSFQEVCTRKCPGQFFVDLHAVIPLRAQVNLLLIVFFKWHMDRTSCPSTVVPLKFYLELLPLYCNKRNSWKNIHHTKILLKLFPYLLPFGRNSACCMSRPTSSHDPMGILCVLFSANKVEHRRHLLSSETTPRKHNKEWSHC